MMGLVPAGKTLMRFLETSEVGDGFCRLFNKWLARQAGDSCPLARAEIMPADIDHFAERVDYSKDSSYQAVLYLYVMMVTGSRTSSLIPTKDTKHCGLLVQDLEFTLLPNGRLIVDVTIKREKQTVGVDEQRIIHVEDRKCGMSVPMLLFCQLVLVGAFELEPEAILDGGNDLGMTRFEYKEHAKKLTVFRHSDGRLTVHPMVNDLTVFDCTLSRWAYLGKGFPRGLFDEVLRWRSLTTW